MHANMESICFIQLKSLKVNNEVIILFLCPLIDHRWQSTETLVEFSLYNNICIATTKNKTGHLLVRRVICNSYIRRPVY